MALKLHAFPERKHPQERNPQPPLQVMQDRDPPALRRGPGGRVA